MQRFLVPGLAAAGAIFACFALLEWAGPSPDLAGALGRVASGLLLLGPPLLVVGLFLLRAPPAARVVSALLPLLGWWAFSTLQRSLLRGPAEGLFHGVFVLNLALYAVVLAEVALAEGACRVVARAFGRRARLASPAFLLLLGAGVAAPFLLGKFGVPLFLAYGEGYQRLFLEGQLPVPTSHVGALPPGSVAPPARRPPNVVVILSDDHRADVAGYAGHPFAQTPSLDRLAREGVRFRHAYATTALCSPSRASFLTGQYAHRHGVFNNTTAWHDENRTLFEYLHQAGYATAFIGKWHMPGGLPTLRGVDHFATFTVVGGQGVYRNCPLVVDGREEVSSKEYIAEELTDRALAWIEARAGGEQPFVLWLAHKNVHMPFQPDAREAGRHAREEPPLPAGVHAFTGLLHGQEAHFSLAALDDLARRYTEAVASMDREIGRVLDRLDTLGIADETWVVYASDQGYLWGEHGHIDKRWPWEESIRLPLLVRGPGVPAGADREALVANIDLAPTLLALAGIETPAHMDGSSLLPLLEDEAPRDWRRELYYYYPFEPPYPTPTTHALRTGRYKYVEFEGAAPLLFDLDADPHERRDLAQEPQHDAVRRDLAARLASWRRHLASGTPLPR